jgi:hypothetical protein
MRMMFIRAGAMCFRPFSFLPEEELSMSKRKNGNPRLNATVRKLFLDHLAQTANVSAAARHAGVSGDDMYGLRKRSADFAAGWHEALCEGYVRMETEMLAEALQNASSGTSDSLLKARAQKHRLRLGLMRAHYNTVKGGVSPASAPRMPTADLATLKAQLVLKLTQMRDRAGIALNGGNEGAADA